MKTATRTVATLKVEEVTNDDGKTYFRWILDYPPGTRPDGVTHSAGGAHHSTEARALAEAVMSLEMELRPEGADHAWKLATIKAGEPHPWGPKGVPW